MNAKIEQLQLYTVSCQICEEKEVPACERKKREKGNFGLKNMEIGQQEEIIAGDFHYNISDSGCSRNTQRGARKVVPKSV